MLTVCRELLLQDVVTVATEPRPLSGVEAQTARGHCVMLVGYVSALIDLDVRFLWLTSSLDYAKLTRKMGSKSSTTGSNLRPKEMSQNSP